MNESKMFAPEAEVPEDKKAEKPLKYIEADRDGLCSHCHEAYKKGDKIALYKSKDEIEFDKTHGTNTPPSPYHIDCVDELIAKESE